MAIRVTPFLMFAGRAEEAMNLYVSLFNIAGIKLVDRYTEKDKGITGKVKKGIVMLNGVDIICVDSDVKHDFTFTPASSIFVECSTKFEIQDIFNALSEDGKVIMPLDNYGFSEKYAWLNDRFGVSWQLSWG